VPIFFFLFLEKKKEKIKRLAQRDELFVPIKKKRTNKRDSRPSQGQEKRKD
jgi:hypothetical protein